VFRLTWRITRDDAQEMRDIISWVRNNRKRVIFLILLILQTQDCDLIPNFIFFAYRIITSNMPATKMSPGGKGTVHQKLLDDITQTQAFALHTEKPKGNYT
jgi:hypothetical protein